MNPRITLVVVVAFAALAYYVFFVEAPKGPAQLGTPARPAPRIFTLPVGEIKTIQVRDLRKARELQATRVDNTKWQIEKPEVKPANTTKIEDIADGFAQLQAARVFTDVVDLTPYGVLTPMLEARVIMRDSTPYALSVGNKTPDGQGYYASYPGDKTLFIIAGRLIDELLSWFDNPPYEPAPMPTFTATPPVTSTPPVTPTIPSFVPTLVPVATATP